MNILDQYRNIYLIEKKQDNTASELKDVFPDQKICVCDFRIEGSENGKLNKRIGVINYDGLLIIDHHLSFPMMKEHVSSTTFAIKYVTKFKSLSKKYALVINHADTDSVLSSLIMSGLLKPCDEFNAAAIAADHTGEENIISDVLQALEDDKDLQKSIDVLQKVLEKRFWKRRELKLLVDNGEFKWDGNIAYRIINQKIDAGLLPCIFPKADAIVVAWLMPEGSKGKWGIKVRLGPKANEIALNEMNLPATGGRWDAISTTRHGGTNIEPEDYMKLVKEGIEKQRTNATIKK